MSPERANAGTTNTPRVPIAVSRDGVIQSVLACKAPMVYGVGWLQIKAAAAGLAVIQTLTVGTQLRVARLRVELRVTQATAATVLAIVET